MGKMSEWQDYLRELGKEMKELRLHFENLRRRKRFKKYEEGEDKKLTEWIK